MLTCLCSEFPRLFEEADLEAREEFRASYGTFFLLDCILGDSFYAFGDLTF